jgi:hypothetical protein
MFAEPRIELADILAHGIAVILIIVWRVARCNDRTRRPIPGAQ